MHRPAGTTIELTAEPDLGSAVSTFDIAGFWAVRLTVVDSRGVASINALADAVVQVFRDLTGYDRVMVYKFDPEGHGKVIAEARDPRLESLLGHHYPASDIPQRARELYLRNRVRVLVDVDYTPSPLVPRRPHGSDAELDMSLCGLRSMSPLHLQYLKNMGVTGTLGFVVDGGNSWDEVVQLAKAIEAAGATILNTGIGWHEARIPTIATSVPRAAFAWVTKKMKAEVKIPLVTSNRINTPELADLLLAEGYADMVSMARPLLADPHFVKKAAQGRAREINTCIACNQACLDHVFDQKLSSCLVNPRACHETEIRLLPTATKKTVAVVGAGPAGLAAATTLAERGHTVHLVDAAAEIGGQLNLACMHCHDQRAGLRLGGATVCAAVAACASSRPRSPELHDVNRRDRALEA